MQKYVNLTQHMSAIMEHAEREMLQEFLELCDAFQIRPLLMRAANYSGTVKYLEDVLKTLLTWCAVYRYAIEDAKVRANYAHVHVITTAFDRLLHELSAHELSWI